MTEPDFSDITGEETSSNEGGNSSPDKRGHKKVHVKCRYGTHTYNNTNKCEVCRRKPVGILLVGVNPRTGTNDHDFVKYTCENHEGDIRGDLEYPPEQVVRVDFPQDD